MFVSSGLAILHADVDAFYASVAQRDAPELRGRPVIVGSWVVMAASYEARAFGVRGGMGTMRARRRCPDAIVVDTDWPAYVEASRAVFEIFERWAPVVEPGSMEEAFLDVRGAAAPAAQIALALRREVREQVGLPLSVGVARTKVLAKIASRSAKPDGLFVVPPEREVEFLHALPVERLWGVGPGDGAQAPRRRTADRRPGGTAGRGGAHGDGWARRRAGTSTRSRTTASTGRCAGAAAGGRSAPSVRWAARRARGRTSTRLWTGSPSA